MHSILAVAFGTYFVGSFIGYGIHRVLHHPSAGVMYESHYYHHWTVYPPEDFLSEKYREPEKGQAAYYLAPILAVAALALFWHWGYSLLIAGEGLAVLKLNAVVHDNIHIRGHRWERYRWFWKLRGKHYQHHVEVLSNLGILSLFPDRVLRTHNKDARLPDRYLQRPSG